MFIKESMQSRIEAINKNSEVGRWVCDMTRKNNVTNEALYIDGVNGTSEVFRGRYIRRRSDVE